MNMTAVCVAKARNLMVNWNIADVILIVGHSSPAARDCHVTFGGAAISTVSEKLDAFIEKPNEVCVLTTGNRFKGANEPRALPQVLP